jgi:xylulose-5-phosphate/fructose-6-phosphate phosphoketolase
MAPSKERLDHIDAHFRAANFIGAAQLYLRDNALLREPLKPENIKARLLGHWGTQPGLNLIYAHLNRLIQDTAANILLVVGPGHGAPAILADLYLEGTLSECYPRYSQDAAGLNNLVHDFSWPGGLPSHLTALTPGAMHEGGELGYSLMHAYGAAFDNPDLIVACVVGDGEAESGPLAASWHSNKFLNAANDGAVLPILHLNGYKLSGPSLLARMSDDELRNLFAGYGYHVRFVEGDDPSHVHAEMWPALDSAYHEIRSLQGDARRGEFRPRPVWPMLILKTPKGWTGPKTLDGKPVEGTFHSHQIPIVDPATNPAHLKLVENWLRSYRPEQLFDPSGKPAAHTTAICPKGEKRMGQNPHANGGALLQELRMPDYAQHAVAVPTPGGSKAENTKILGALLRDIFRDNQDARNFRLFCPDETTSNRLQAVYEATSRAFELPLVPTDEFLRRDGRVMEILSEHCCQGWLEGYLLTGRHGIFACYEAFITIIDSMVAQYAKWSKMAREVAWRKPVASLNYLLTSHVWQQDHNGYSHQGPGFINTLLTRKREVTRIYLPPDANCLLSIADHCLRSRDYINLIVASKNPMPQWLDMPAAREHCAKGVSIWSWAGNEGGQPDVVLAAAGDVPTQEMMAAAWLLRREAPEMRVRVVNVVDLFTLQSHNDHPHGLDEDQFCRVFTDDTPVVFAFHGYPGVIHELIHHRPRAGRFHVRGYIEEGTTTTPFDMTVLNELSRYHLAMEALRRAPNMRSVGGDVIQKFERKLKEHRLWIQSHDEDMPEILNWKWSAQQSAGRAD